jgi:proton-dependent oligopeptide transporter, POT family
MASSTPPMASASPRAQSHPTGLFVLFTTEMWERFAYYGMRAILKLYMAKALLFDEKFSSELYGSYTGLVYLTPLLGGYIADRYWGNRRSIMVGGLLMALGQFALFASASTLGNAGASHLMFYIGLALMIFGNGFFKPNISSMVGTLYPPADSRIDAAYTIFYMGINLGAFFSPLVCGALGDTGNPADFKWGFLAAGIGMVIGVITFELLKNKFVVKPDGSPLGARPEPKVLAVGEAPAATITPTKMLMLGGLFAVVFFGLYKLLEGDWIGAIIFTSMIVVPLIVISDPSLTAREKEKIYVVLILSFFVIFFWGAFEQAGNSLTTFADKQTDRQLGSYTVPASFFQSINALAVIAFAPIFALLWGFLSKRGMEPSSPLKMAYGLALLAVGYLVIALGVQGATETTKVSMFWLIALYLIHTFGELCLSPIGLALVNKLSPARFASLMMAVWFLATAAGNKFSGTLGALYPEPGKPAPHFAGFEITGLYEFFMVFVVLCGGAAFVLLLIYRILVRMMEGNDATPPVQLVEHQ